MKVRYLVLIPALAIIGAGIPAAISYAGSGKGFFEQSAHASERHGGGGFAKMCRHEPVEKAEKMIGIVEGLMTFTPEQEQAWTQLAGSLRSGAESVENTCDQVLAEGRARTAPEKMARLETMLGTGLAALQDIRPAFDSFYGTLSEKQQETLDKLASKRHRRHHDHD